MAYSRLASKWRHLNNPAKNGTEDPSVNNIIATERYITGCSCKGNRTTGAISDLCNDIISCTDDSVAPKSLCTKPLMGTVKRDISAVEASYELSSLPLYRSNHTFQSISLSGARILGHNGIRVIRNTALDRYMERSNNDRSSFYSFICQTGKVPVIPQHMQHGL